MKLYNYETTALYQDLKSSSVVLCKNINVTRVFKRHTRLKVLSRWKIKYEIRNKIIFKLNFPEIL